MSINPVTAMAGVYAFDQLVRSAARPLAAGAAFAHALLADSPNAKPSQPAGRPNGSAGATYELPVGASTAQWSASATGVEGTADSDGALQRRIAHFHAMLEQRMRAAGLDWQAPLRIRSDVFGGVDAVEDHPQAIQIEELLARDSALSQAWEELVHLLRQPHAMSRADSGLSGTGGPATDVGPQADSQGHDSSAFVELVIDEKKLTVTVGQ